MSRTLLREMLRAYPEKTTYLSLIQHANEEPQIVNEVQWNFNGKDLSDRAKALSELYPEKAGDGMHLWGQVPPWIYAKANKEGWDKSDWKRWCNGPEGQSYCIWRRGKGRRTTKV